DTVHDDGAVERDGAGPGAPQRQEPPAPGLHRRQRDEPERVVEEVEDDVRQEDQRGAQAQPADVERAHAPGGPAPCCRSTSSMIIVLRSSTSFARSTRPSFRISSRTREGRADSMTRVVPMATASSIECVTNT